MRTLLVLVVLTVLFVFGTVAMAAEWNGVGVQIGLNSSKELSVAQYHNTTAHEFYTNKTSLTANATLFGVPRNGDGMNMAFAYAGPKWDRKYADGRAYYIQPQFGWAGGWFSDDGVIAALWTGGTIPGTKISLDLDLESINGGSQHDYFGWYKLSMPAGPIKVGTGVEQVNGRYNGCVSVGVGGIEYRQYTNLRHGGQYCGRVCVSIDL